MEWYLGVLRKYRVFGGRARRLEYWMFVFINLLAVLVLGFIEGLIGLRFGDTGVLSGLYCLAVMLPGLAVGARRLHDTDRSAWWLLIGLVPGVGLLVLLVFFALDGTEGRNRFGPDPKRADAAVPV
ncbi:MAG: DUF805 domain-containing protein [Candidatus Dactylopiibacterium sp.]|nr:DUF805 domain-containing protein [Candidatus Dactylopiibacterium sp.]